MNFQSSLQMPQQGQTKSLLWPYTPCGPAVPLACSRASGVFLHLQNLAFAVPSSKTALPPVISLTSLLKCHLFDVKITYSFLALCISLTLFVFCKSCQYRIYYKFTFNCLSPNQNISHMTEKILFCSQLCPQCPKQLWKEHRHITNVCQINDSLISLPTLFLASLPISSLQKPV